MTTTNEEHNKKRIRDHEARIRLFQILCALESVKGGPLSQAEIDDLNDKYRTKGIATDKKGNPLISRGEVVWKTERDSVHATQMMIVKALVYPNLADPDLMDYYHCVDVTEMPRKVFSRTAEYTTVLKAVMEVCGIIDKDDEKATLEEAKN